MFFPSQNCVGIRSANQKKLRGDRPPGDLLQGTQRRAFCLLKIEKTYIIPKFKAGHIITEIDVEETGRPNKRIIYPVGLAVLGLVIGLQLRRRHREDPRSE